MLYTKERFDAKVVVLRIVILQLLFYGTLALTHLALVAPYYVSPSSTTSDDSSKDTRTHLLGTWMIFDWTSVQYSIYSFQGAMTAASYALTSLVMALCVWKLVTRSSKCADFSFTIYFVHVIMCWIYSKDTHGFPTSVSFWICMSISCATTAVVAERLCMREELEEIPLTSLVQSRSQDTVIDMRGATRVAGP